VRRDIGFCVEVFVLLTVNTIMYENREPEREMRYVVKLVESFERKFFT